MKKSTRQIIKILLEADDSIPTEHQATIWEAVTGRPKETRGLPMLVTQGQVAELLGVSRTTVYRLVKSKILCPVRVLGSKRFNRSEIDQFARRGTEQ